MPPPAPRRPAPAPRPRSSARRDADPRSSVAAEYLVQSAGPSVSLRELDADGRRRETPRANNPGQVTATRSFDTEQAGSSYATGFVVDARRGIILTNRHVVKTGAITPR